MEVKVTRNSYHSSKKIELSGAGLPAPLIITFISVSRDDVEWYFEYEPTQDIEGGRSRFLPGCSYSIERMATLAAGVMTKATDGKFYTGPTIMQQLRDALKIGASSAESRYGYPVEDFDEVGYDAAVIIT